MGDNEKNFKNGEYFFERLSTENDFTFYLTG